MMRDLDEDHDMADKDLAFITATEAIAAFRARKLSPVELLKAVEAQFHKVNRKVNAFTYTFFDQALIQARNAEKRYATGRPTKPLEGVPLMIKDIHAIKGYVTTYGSLLYKDNVDKTTELFVERMLKAKPVLVGRSTNPEFAASCITHSRLWGITRNPWNTRYNSGGSTGGGAAAVASGMTVLSDGSDYAGSIRVPSSCCGVFGFKPPSGRVPHSQPWNLNGYSVYGPITRSVADAALMMNVIAGHDLRDITSVKEKLRYPDRYERIKGWRIAYSPDLGSFEVDPEVARKTRAALDAFREAGAEIEEIELDWPKDIALGFLAHARETDFEPAHLLPPRKRKLLTEYIRANTPRNDVAKRLGFVDSLNLRAEMWAKLAPVLKRCQILLCPTLAIPAQPANYNPVDRSFKINGKKVESEIGWVMTFPFNMLGQLPAATVPCGFAKSGVPIGLQIVGRPYDDLSVFQAAAAFEKARPWRKYRPKI
jgi:Asp-tRNA(Asn)/Glu-tRNA(Gln) amidotransferase A subunit family amidase